MARFDAIASTDGTSAGAKPEADATSTILSHEGNAMPAGGGGGGGSTASTDRGHWAHAGTENKGGKSSGLSPHVTTPETSGIDVSEFNKTVDWSQVANAGAKFAFIRATDGTTIQDANFAQNWKGAEDAGLLVGPYHYLTTTSPVASQIQNFTKTISTVDAGNLPPVIDVEDPAQFAKYTVAQRVDMIQQMLDGVQAATGEQPILYMSPDFASQELNNAPQFAKYTFWDADYNGASQPDVPKPWTNWNFWQHTDSGAISGVTGAVDLDYFNGTVDQLPITHPAKASASK